MTPDLFADDAPLAGARTPLGAQAVVLRGLALDTVDALWAALQAVVAPAPFRTCSRLAARPCRCR